MAGGLTTEQMEFLLGKGLSAEEMVAFAKLSDKPARSANAERQARFRRRRKGIPEPDNVTSNVTSNALHPPIEDHTPLVSSDEETIPPAPKAKRVQPSATPAKPEGVKEQTWRDFLRVRDKKRAPMTETALTGIEAEARKAGWSLENALAKCAVKGWQSFEADWVASARAPPEASLVAGILGKQAATA